MGIAESHFAKKPQGGEVIGLRLHLKHANTVVQHEIPKMLEELFRYSLILIVILSAEGLDDILSFKNTNQLI